MTTAEAGHNAGELRDAKAALPAVRSVRAWVTLLLVLFGGLSLDLVTKSLAFERVAGQPVILAAPESVAQPNYRLPYHEGVQALPFDLLDFHLVLNHGAVFGIGQHRRSLFIAFTILAVVVAVGVFGWWTRASSWLAHVAIGLILAGGIGNLYDRISVGAVRDFLHLLPRWHLPWGLHWPGGSSEVFPWVFNGADVLLLAGMTLLVIHSHWQDGARGRIEQAHDSGEAAGGTLSKSVGPTDSSDSNDRA